MTAEREAALPEFKASPPDTVGVELELQLLNTRDYNLSRDAADLINLLEKESLPGEIKPEITESMIEINSSVHTAYDKLVDELQLLRDVIARAAARLNIAVSGGGSHAFHSWADRRIYPTERFTHVLERYGYLAKQFTIFGQHVHVGCPDGDAAVYLTHMFARYVPHFIALSCSSPYQQGEDTAYHSSRLNTVSAFPLSGHMPSVRTWSEFGGYFRRMHAYGIAASMKDFYWDVRPKPEYGTVEIRVFDTPLTVMRAAQLAVYAQALARHLLHERPYEPQPVFYEVHAHNRFQACRYGFGAQIVDPLTGRRCVLRDAVLESLRSLRPHAGALGSGDALAALEQSVLDGYTDAGWLRERHARLGALHDVVREQSALWMTGVRP